MRFLLLILVTLLGGVSGCGYRSSAAGDAWAGKDAGPLYVSLFENRTREPLLENFLADEVTLRFARSRVFALTEDRQVAGTVLTGRIEEFAARAIAYDARDRITEYRAVMRLEARLVDADGGTVLWQDRLTRTENFLATARKDQQLDNRELAARELAARLAEDLYIRLLNTF